MGDITIFELHFDGGLQLGPSFGDDPTPDVEATDGGTPTRADDDADGASATPAVDVDPDGDGAGSERKTPVKGAILGVVALVVLAAAARVLLGGDDDVDDVEMVELDDVDEAGE
ncbi:hypothetical protein [Halorubellus sp. PRR65]|uniref:hypothetical protein n=1 Tax=Halorubellus sp. PRR65 TaxID=3098148 RepID=UPI002B25C4CE|nr:hypothetical protein [Halorubellus sp. PRR65]